MTRALAYDRRVFAPAGPRRLRCLLCGVSVSSNALARSAHERSVYHRKLLQSPRGHGLGYMQGRGAS